VECDLSFADPMGLREAPQDLYGKAYLGERHECEMEEYAYRLSLRAALICEPELWAFNPPAIHRILSWLREQVPANGTVFEVGCALGFFLHTLRREGYKAIGLDVAKPAVDLNRQDGFTVWHGTVETVPSDFVSPDAIVGLFMIHHLEDPGGFLRTLIARWPTAKIAIAAYGDDFSRGGPSLPPRTLTKWSSKSLTAALSAAGYRAAGVDVPSTGAEHRALVPLRWLMRGTVKAPVVYRLGKRIQRRLLPKLMRPFQRPGYTVLAFGVPPVTS